MSTVLDSINPYIDAPAFITPRTIIKVGDGGLQIGCNFDKALCLLEVRNFERVAKLHLKRCDDPATAKEISLVLQSLADGFANKKV